MTQTQSPIRCPEDVAATKRVAEALRRAFPWLDAEDDEQPLSEKPE